MQLYNGAVSYWPGGDYESWWGTAYAAHFLYEAKKAGFEVNDNILNKMYGYLQTKLRTKETELYYYQDENGIARSRTIAKKEIPYSIFVLALDGRYEKTSMNYYKANTGDLSLDGRYLLSCAYALSGNMAAFKDLLPASFTGEVSKRAFGAVSIHLFGMKRWHCMYCLNHHLIIRKLASWESTYRKNLNLPNGFPRKTVPSLFLHWENGEACATERCNSQADGEWQRDWIF